MNPSSHGAPIEILFGVLALLLILARFAGRIAMKLGLPSVLGELILGALLGTIPGFAPNFQHHPAFEFMMELGALLLLFEVGLESSFSELRRVGASAGRVALVGMVAPLFFGVAVSKFLEASPHLPGHIFIGATLAATSVGITARVLRDLGQSQSSEAKIILAAAVFDDILGLILLAVVSSMVRATNGGELNFISVLVLILKSLLFIGTVLTLGRWLVPFFFKISARLMDKGALLTTSIGICLAFSTLAYLFGLAPIVGAFFAGLVIQPKDFSLFSKKATEGVLEELLKPLSTIFVPLFFVMTGLKVDLSVFRNPQIFPLGLLLSAAAILGKVLSGYAAGKGSNRLIIGVGMVPRGEVGLIFASLGINLSLYEKPLLSPTVFGALITVVTVTSIVSPIWLGNLLRKRPTLTREGKS